MVDTEEWRWIEEHATGGFDHLLLGTSVPVLLGPGMHHLQAWNEAVDSGVWGERAAQWGEKIRRSKDLDHWSSFHDSFTKLTRLIRAVGAGERGQPPASIIVLSGDVHHGYLAEATFRDKEVKSEIYQAVSSPFRNSLPGEKSRLFSASWRKLSELVGRFLARLAGIGEEGMSWQLDHPELWYENQVATLELEGRQATLTFEKAILDDSKEPGLKTIYERKLT